MSGGAKPEPLELDTGVVTSGLKSSKLFVRQLDQCKLLRPLLGIFRLAFSLLRTNFLFIIITIIATLRTIRADMTDLSTMVACSFLLPVRHIVFSFLLLAASHKSSGGRVDNRRPRLPVLVFIQHRKRSNHVDRVVIVAFRKVVLKLFGELAITALVALGHKHSRTPQFVRGHINLQSLSRRQRIVSCILIMFQDRHIVSNGGIMKLTFV